ncbi:hypothetical protein HK107_04320 [Parvularcula sp. ZS-1/3]|uniref:Uncharacterized protein n=1 Tax=Parvularcula mediterranea TaxID=2732508 RepID=A0A7Y3RK38_9PROT|nr:hypothetical protein [Parvularcula mediterranea]NNU15542.1 hypothetical protein [Parvularcula mediterranea]
MVGINSNYSAKSALFQLRAQGQAEAKSRFGGPLLNSLGKGRGNSAAFFSVTGAQKSESAIVRTLGESLGKARNTVAAAQTGVSKVGEVLGKVDTLIAAVEAGAPGSAFKGAFDGLQREADLAVARSGFSGTNLLKEGEVLTVTVGLKAGSDYDFRQLNFEAVGLSPTDAAKEVTTVTKTVTETVETPITREQKLTERLEKLGQRIERFEARETRLESRLDKLTTREEKLTNRLERFEKVEQRLNNKLEKVGARPTDARDAFRLETAKRYAAFADRLEERGSTRIAAFVDAVANRVAESAGLTVSLDKLAKIEKRLERTETRIEKTNAKINKTAERQTFISDRLTKVSEKKAAISEKIDDISERLDHLSPDKLNEVVGTVTETVERTVTEVVKKDENVGFENLIGGIAEKLAAGDTEGAKALAAEAKARVERVDEQLGRIKNSLGRQSSFFGAVADRIDSQIKVKVEDKLGEDDAARRAAAILSGLAKTEGLLGGDARPGILALFETGGSAPGENAGFGEKDAEDDKPSFYAPADQETEDAD